MVQVDKKNEKSLFQFFFGPPKTTTTQSRPQSTSQQQTVQNRPQSRPRSTPVNAQNGSRPQSSKTKTPTGKKSSATKAAAKKRLTSTSPERDRSTQDQSSQPKSRTAPPTPHSMDTYDFIRTPLTQRMSNASRSSNGSNPSHLRRPASMPELRNAPPPFPLMQRGYPVPSPHFAPMPPPMAPTPMAYPPGYYYPAPVPMYDYYPHPATMYAQPGYPPAMPWRRNPGYDYEEVVQQSIKEAQNVSSCGNFLSFS
jgi:hypothetical protein